MSDEVTSILAELMDTSSESEEDDILEFIEQESDENLFELDLVGESGGQKRTKIENYMEEVVPLYTDEEFRQHFRISKNAFNTLTERFAESETFSRLRPDKRLPAATYIAVFLWFAGHEACSFRDLSDRFNLAISSVSRIIEKTIMFVSNLSPQFIKWPNEAEKEESANFFAAKCGFPKVIGCIDGTHITMDPPTQSKDDYIDRKGNITLKMQAVCDHNKKFINVFVGFPGSCHDSWVFQNSPLHHNLATSCGDYYLLGDSAYPCSKHVVTPYKDNGHLSRSQKNFNVQLSSGRVFIEHAFGILKQRFRQLYYCKLKGMRKLCHFIRACCVLHNIANDNDLVFTENLQEDDADNETTAEPDLSSGNAVRDSIRAQIESNTI